MWCYTSLCSSPAKGTFNGSAYYAACTELTEYMEWTTRWKEKKQRVHELKARWVVCCLAQVISRLLVKLDSTGSSLMSTTLWHKLQHKIRRTPGLTAYPSNMLTTLIA